jgi:hypothetical protein
MITALDYIHLTKEVLINTPRWKTSINVEKRASNPAIVVNARLQDKDFTLNLSVTFHAADTGKLVQVFIQEEYTQTASLYPDNSRYMLNMSTKKSTFVRLFKNIIQDAEEIAVNKAGLHAKIAQVGGFKE